MEITIRFATFLLVLCSCFMFLACGSDSGEDDKAVATQQTPEGLAKLLVEEMKQGEFSCASNLYFKRERILEYFDASVLGPGGPDGVCQSVRDDARTQMYTTLQGSPLEFGTFSIDEQNNMPKTKSGTTLPYIEGTITSTDGSKGVHINRMVQYEGNWYILVLMSHIYFY